MSKKTLRQLAAAAFLLLALLGLILPTGWGTPSSFGIRAVEWICPVGALEVMLAEKALIPRALTALVVVILLTVLLGRFFCGWLCPIPWLGKFFAFSRLHGKTSSDQSSASAKVVGPDARCASSACKAASETLPAAPLHGCSATKTEASHNARVGTSQTDAGTKPSKTPFLVLGGALASSAVFGFPVFCLVCPVGLFFAAIVALWRLFVGGDGDWAILWFVGILGLEILFLRRWCASFCPIGALFSIFARFNRTFRPTACAHCVKAAEGAPCTRCRDACPEGLDPSAPDKDPALWSRCTKCGACAEACLPNAIRFLWRLDGRTALPAEDASEASPVVNVWKGPAVVAASAASSDDPLSACTHCAKCAAGCPLGDAMPEVLAAFAKGERAKAESILLAPGRFPEICARVCPSSTLCEAACAHGVPIAKLEMRLADEALARGWKPSLRRAARTRRVAVVGSGPAGLSCADVLARNGVWVDVFERRARPGGLLADAFPERKLPRKLLERRIDLMTHAGVRFLLGVNVGVDKPWSELFTEYDAVYAALGAGPGVDPDICGIDSVRNAKLRLPNALQFLEDRANARGMYPTAKNKTVVVLGGGDTALDVVRTVLDEGAARVLLVARKPLAHLRADPEALAQACRRGLKILDECEVLRVSDADENRNLALLVRRPDGAQTLPADLIVTAWGQCWGSDADFSELGLALAKNRRAVEPLSGQNPLVFAGGDFTRGAALVVDAVADGREGARRIGRRLGIPIELERD